MSEGREPYAAWTVLELMGHRRLAGYVTEQEIAGHGYLRLDVHDADRPVVTQFYSPSAVYCMTPTTEEIARGLGARLRPAPVSRYELEPPGPREPDPWDCGRDDLGADPDGASDG